MREWIARQAVDEDGLTSGNITIIVSCICTEGKKEGEEEGEEGRKRRRRREREKEEGNCSEGRQEKKKRKKHNNNLTARYGTGQQSRACMSCPERKNRAEAVDSPTVEPANERRGDSRHSRFGAPAFPNFGPLGLLGVYLGRVRAGKAGGRPARIGTD